MKIEDTLSDISADLVEFEKYDRFLKRLFAAEAGKWIDVSILCRGLNDVEERLKEVERRIEGTLQVTWLDFPNALSGDGFCVIVFFTEALQWSNVALYNKNHLLQT